MERCLPPHLRDAKNGWRTINMMDHICLVSHNPTCPRWRHECTTVAVQRDERGDPSRSWHVTTKTRNLHCARWPCCCLTNTRHSAAFLGLLRAYQTCWVEWPQNDHGRHPQGTRYLLFGKDGTVSEGLCVSVCTSRISGRSCGVPGTLQ